ncbi:MAG: hypothetical protein R3246_15405, partial [Acidimicrobiia bacterium]|nr:hypothetical protein [Acidimicrobiia bacterium]
LDAEGRIWVMYSVPDDDWEEVVGTDGPHGFSVEDYHGYYDTVVEVIDPEETRVVAMSRFDSNAFYFVRPLEIAVIARVEDEPYLDVYRLGLEVPR